MISKGIIELKAVHCDLMNLLHWLYLSRNITKSKTVKNV